MVEGEKCDFYPKPKIKIKNLKILNTNIYTSSIKIYDEICHNNSYTQIFGSQTTNLKMIKSLPKDDEIDLGQEENLNQISQEEEEEENCFMDYDKDFMMFLG